MGTEFPIYLLGLLNVIEHDFELLCILSAVVELQSYQNNCVSIIRDVAIQEQSLDDVAVVESFK